MSRVRPAKEKQNVVTILRLIISIDPTLKDRARVETHARLNAPNVYLCEYISRKPLDGSLFYSMPVPAAAAGTLLLVPAGLRPKMCFPSISQD